MVGNEIIDLFKNDQFDKCVLFYNNFKKCNYTDSTSSTNNSSRK